MSDDKKTLHTAIIVSVVFHLLLLLIFILIEVGFTYNIADFTEIAFASVRPTNMRRNTKPVKSQPVQPETRTNESAS